MFYTDQDGAAYACVQVGQQGHFAHHRLPSTVDPCVMADIWTLVI